MGHVFTVGAAVRCDFKSDITSYEVLENTNGKMSLQDSEM